MLIFGVIPVSRHWDPENLISNEYARWLYNKNWIPVSSTGMTPFAVHLTFKNEHSHSYTSRAGVKLKAWI
jgi:WPE domain-containing protein